MMSVVPGELGVLVNVHPALKGGAIIFRADGARAWFLDWCLAFSYRAA